MKTVITFILIILSYSVSNICSATPPPLPSPTSSKEPIVFQVGSTYLSIPAEYFDRGASLVPSTNSKVTITFLLPSLKPYGAEVETMNMPPKEKEEWRKNNTPISIQLVETPDMRPYINQGARFFTVKGNLAAIYKLNSLNTSQEVDEKAIREKILSFILDKKPDDWDETQELIKTLRVSEMNHGWCGTESLTRKAPAQKPALIPIDTLKKALANNNQAIRNTAIVRLREYETNREEIVTLLINTLKTDTSPTVRAAALQSLAKFQDIEPSIPQIVLDALRNDKSTEVRQAASSVISQVKNIDVSALISLLSDPKLSTYVIRGLEYVVLNDSRTNKVDDYSKLNNDSKRAVTTLVSILENESPRNKIEILNALGNKASASPEFIKATIRLLNDSEASVVNQAALSIQRIGEIANEAAPHLTKIINSPNIKLYKFSIDALGNLGKASKPAIPRIIELASFECPKSSATASSNTSILSISEQNKTAACQASDSKWIKSSAITALGNLGIRTPETEKIIYDALNSEDHQIAYVAILSAIKLKFDSERLASIFVKKLRSSNDSTKIKGMTGLGKLGKQALDSLDELKPFLNDPNPQLKKVAEDTIKKITEDK